ncbi:hypothetical protein T492DRAFT_836981 [Pavlovales sp. CCMP2436]|nr:hypothetical protein T492DRAFT_836981 [Pavlovales sp. CCMP2436]
MGEEDERARREWMIYYIRSGKLDDANALGYRHERMATRLQIYARSFLRRVRTRVREPGFANRQAPSAGRAGAMPKQQPRRPAAAEAPTRSAAGAARPQAAAEAQTPQAFANGGALQGSLTKEGFLDLLFTPGALAEPRSRRNTSSSLASASRGGGLGESGRRISGSSHASVDYRERAKLLAPLPEWFSATLPDSSSRAIEVSGNLARAAGRQSPQGTRPGSSPGREGSGGVAKTLSPSARDPASAKDFGLPLRGGASPPVPGSSSRQGQSSPARLQVPPAGVAHARPAPEVGLGVGGDFSRPQVFSGSDSGGSTRSELGTFRTDEARAMEGVDEVGSGRREAGFGWSLGGDGKEYGTEYGTEYGSSLTERARLRLREWEAGVEAGARESGREEGESGRSPGESGRRKGESRRSPEKLERLRLREVEVDAAAADTGMSGISPPRQAVEAKVRMSGRVRESGRGEGADERAGERELERLRLLEWEADAAAAVTGKSGRSLPYSYSRACAAESTLVLTTPPPLNSARDRASEREEHSHTNQPSPPFPSSIQLEIERARARLLKAEVEQQLLRADRELLRGEEFEREGGELGREGGEFGRGEGNFMRRDSDRELEREWRAARLGTATR